jgi:hypothetical protein
MKPILIATGLCRLLILPAFADPAIETRIFDVTPHFIRADLDETGRWLALNGIDGETPTAKATLESAGIEMTFSGQPALSRLGHRRCGATAVLSADNSQVELDLYLPETGEALLEKDAILRPTIRTTIPTGHTAVVAVKRPDGANRLVLVQAQIFEDPVAPVPEVVPNESVPKAE